MGMVVFCGAAEFKMSLDHVGFGAPELEGLHETRRRYSGERHHECNEG